MPTSILQEFLNQQFIVPENDENIGSLQKTAAELERKLRGTRRKDIPKVVLLAFDPEAPADDPMFTQVQELLVAKWRNFAGKSQDQPITYLRAVILTALESLATDPRLAGVIWLTASNYIRYTATNHRESVVLHDFLRRIGNAYEAAAWKSWELGQGIEMPILPELVQEGLEEIAEIASDSIAESLTVAVGTGKTFTIYNDPQRGYQVSVPVGAEWANNFGANASDAIASLVNGIVGHINDVLVHAVSSEQLTTFGTAITQQLTAVNALIAQQTSSQDLRNRLLWLKESQYSISQARSYRAVTEPARPIVLAYDAAQQVPEIYPASVEYFLRETLSVVAPQATEEQTFEALLTALAADSTNWRTLLSTVPPPDTGRRTLLAVIASLGQTGNGMSDLQQATGIELTDTISQSDFTVWIFRELEMQKLLASK